jgi:hypothetical protein
MSETSRVIVGVGGRARPVALLHRAAAEARHRRAVLVPVLAVRPGDGADGGPEHGVGGWAEREGRARRELDDLLVDAFGPEDPLVVRPVAVRAANLAEAVAAVAVRPGDTVFAAPAAMRSAWLRGRLGALLAGRAGPDGTAARPEGAADGRAGRPAVPQGR